MSFGDVRGPLNSKNPKHIPQNILYENGSHFWDIFSANHISNFMHTEKDTESEHHIQNINL